MMISTSATAIPSFGITSCLVAAFQPQQCQHGQAYRSNQHTDGGIDVPIACRGSRRRLAPAHAPDNFRNQYRDHSAAERSSDNGQTPDTSVTNRVGFRTWGAVML